MRAMKVLHSATRRGSIAVLRWPRVVSRALTAVSLLSCTPAPAKAPTADSAVARSVLPAPIMVKRVAFRVPDESEVADSNVLTSVRRGRALVRNTRDSLPTHVGNKLQCISCHAADGTQKNAMPLVGVYARFPQYRGRFGATQIIDDRVNDCFKRSLNGKPLDPQSRDMRDIVAYLAFLSLGYPVGAEMEGQGFPKVDPVPGDTTRGAALFSAKCIRCHGPNGDLVTGVDLRRGEAAAPNSPRRDPRRNSGRHRGLCVCQLGVFGAPRCRRRRPPQRHRGCGFCAPVRA